MPEELDKLRIVLQQAASERGLFVFGGEPNVTKLASIAWSDDWLSFLNLAQQAHAHLVYISEQRYDPNLIIVEESGDPELIHDEVDNQTSTTAEAEDERKVWLRARISEHIAPWDARRGEVISVSCIWIRDHVAHHWRQHADWISECRDAINIVLDEAEQIAKENQTLRSQEAARKIHEYATQLVHHPRFPEATSEEKREFMANQLFPDINDDDTLGFRAALSIAKRAILIYWWDVEPMEQVSKIERAKALHRQGESIRNIAAVLKISESKVRAALSDVP